MSGPRYTTIDRDPARAAQQLSENARDTLEALKARPTGKRFVLERYTATGSTSTRIPIGAVGRPWAVRLARAVPVNDESAALTVTPTLNFAWNSTSKAVDVFEPYGLTADTVYKLQFVVEEE